MVYMRKIFYLFVLLSVVTNILFLFFWTAGLWSLVVLIPLILLGFRDMKQTRHAIKANYPIIGHFRYIFEAFRPEINQYFVESNIDGRPFSREQRSIVYQRSKKVLDTVPFGTQQDVYEKGYEFILHSMYPTHVDPESLRVLVGSDKCTKPYSCSLLNISAMSYGSLSNRAVEALSGGAKDGHFAHNTGEGGISPYHTMHGADLIWQIGTGYFGCRTPEGNFNPVTFKEKSQMDNVKMIEIKISQGAKPGHGGILPGKKVNEEIASIRHVEIGKDVISPPGHSAFNTPDELVDFIQELRELSGGKPIGIKVAIGNQHEFNQLVQAMADKKNYPDFIVVDGGEGGTGAAPLEFTNYIGFPGTEALIFVDNQLRKAGIRDQIKIISTGRVTSSFDVLRLLCMGADIAYSARGMMMALGCIQARLCNTNQCPTGIATNNPDLVKGLNVAAKRTRVTNFHNGTMLTLAEMIGAMGVKSHEDLNRSYLMKRLNNDEIKSYEEIFPTAQ